jgi:polysaccharide biosynthesis protein PslH
MKILFVTPFLPSPPRFGGQRRLEGLMKSLAKHHEVSVLSFNATDEFTQLSLDATKAYCKEVVTYPDMEFLDRRRKRVLQMRSILSRKSYEHLLLARRREFQRRLTAMVQSGGYDVVQVEFAQMAAFDLPVARGSRTVSVLDEHNIEFDILKRTASADVGALRRLYSAVDWRKLKSEERSAWRRYQGVAVTSQRDAEILSQLEPATRVVVVPNGVDVEQFRPAMQAPEPDSLLFFGAINYYPNHEGISWFLDQVFPLILAKRPQTKLYVVGPAPDDMLRRSNDNVKVTGFVDEVAPYLASASAVVVPLRIGGGTRLKIVEAMATSKAIVSTRIGAEGIDVVNEEHALLADEPAELAAASLRVLEDAALRERLGQNARRLAEDRYSWASLVKGLEAFYEQLRR